jgi:hypothetical protein
MSFFDSDKGLLNPIDPNHPEIGYGYFILGSYLSDIFF